MKATLLHPASLLDRTGGRAHLIGIAGAGMQSLARVLAQRAWQVSGSDLAPQRAAALLDLGVIVHGTHAAAQVPLDADVVIYSEAIPADNPERRLARDAGLETLRYPQALARLMAGRQGLAVAGTHGKSTTAAMAAEIMTVAELKPTYVVGAERIADGAGGHADTGDFVLVEACEYRAGFLNLAPRMAVVLNIEPDHFDFYRTREQLSEAFAEFARRVPADGVLLANEGCPATMAAVSDAGCQLVTFGLHPWTDWWAADLREQQGRYGYRLFHHGQFVCEVQLQVPGQHNVVNSLAAAALAGTAGCEAGAIRQGLLQFRGLRRRLQVLGEWHGITLVDDYAHHPSEVRSALAAVRQMYRGRRICCVFQPHQVSRTRHLLDEFAASLQNADQLAVAEIYPAREPLHEHHRLTAADLARRVRALGRDVLSVHAPAAIFDRLQATLRPGDVLVTMGAGDIGETWNAIRERIRRHRAAG